MKIHNKNGELSRYGLSCGYIQKICKGDREVSLADECVYQVQFVDHANPLRSWVKWNEDPKVKSWESFESLTEARRRFKQLCKEKLS